MPFKEVLDMFKELYLNDIIHCDLKLENVTHVGNRKEKLYLVSCVVL